MAVRSRFVTTSCRSCDSMVPYRVQRDTVRLAELRVGIWAFRHWTPFDELGREEASSPGYRHAIERQRARQTLPYGFDVWHGAEPAKVLCDSMGGDGTIEVVNFIRGPWGRGGPCPLATRIRGASRA